MNSSVRARSVCAAAAGLVISISAGALAGGSCPDLTGDNAVGPGDLAQLLAAWGPCDDCPADFDNNGVVNAADLAQLLAAWGPCGVVIDNVFPPIGGPGDKIVIFGEFPSDDPFDFCVVLREPDAEGEGVIFAPIEVLDLLPHKGGPGAEMIAQIGPVPDFFQGEVILEIVPGEGGPIKLESPFKFVTLTDDGACWGDPQPGGANIIFNLGGAAVGGGACGPAFDLSAVGVLINGSICVTLPPGPGPGGTYPAGTQIEVWPRYHSCDGTFALDCGTLRFTLNVDLGTSALAGIIEALTNIEIDGCAGPAGPNALANGNQICLRIPDKPACAGNFVICIDLP